MATQMTASCLTRGVFANTIANSVVSYNGNNGIELNNTNGALVNNAIQADTINNNEGHRRGPLRGLGDAVTLLHDRTQRYRRR